MKIIAGDVEQRSVSCLVIRELNVLFVKTGTSRTIVRAMDLLVHNACALIVSIPGLGFRAREAA